MHKAADKIIKSGHCVCRNEVYNADSIVREVFG